MITDRRIPASEPGLSAREAADALRLYGPNVIAPERRRSTLLTWIVRIATDPMALLLVVAATTYALLGDRSDAIVSSLALLPIVLVGVVLEGRADAALARLRALAAPRARVVRDGIEREIPAEEVVPGDALLVGEGDVVAADAELLSGQLAVDESALTGESLPVERTVGDPQLFAGTVAVAGRATARVTATGSATRYGGIAELLGTLRAPRTPIETAIRALVTRLGIFVIAICVAVALVERARGSPWAIAVIAGVSLAMAAMPEELPMVYTLYLAIGAWRLSRDRALVRRLASVETLGATSTICLDKTGTLTYGRLELGEVVALAGADRELVLDTALLATDPASRDPLDAAFARAVSRDARRDAVPAGGEPYDARRRYAAYRWEVDGRRIFAAKGAFEALLPLATVPDDVRSGAEAAHEALAAEGMRVLAVVRGEDDAPPRLIGFAAFRDPVRPDAPDALAACRAAAVRVVMITGDHPATASAVARAVGFGAEATRVVTGDRLAAASPEALPALVDGARVFARIRPDQKLTIVRALRAAGQVVAMTGDGTNDALALREADIGIAMGERGTEVAREAAGLVLLDDDVSTIVRAIRNGRRIFDNLRRAFGYLIGFHAPLIVQAIALPALGLPLLLEPIHLVWLELVVHPTSSLVFESDPPDPEQMRRPPRRRSEPFLRRADWMRPLLLGMTLALVVVAADAIPLARGLGVDAARGTALIAMFVGQTVLVFVQRSPSRPLWRAAPPTRTAFVIAAGTLASLAVALLVPPVAALLRLADPPAAFALAAAAAGALAVLWGEPFKR